MDYIKVYQIGPDVALYGARCFDLDEILDCGQCFRWEKENKEIGYPANGGEYAYSGIAFGRLLRISQNGGTVIFHNTTLADFEKIWMDYFDLRRDYSAIKELLSKEETLEKAVGYAGGIRVLRQEPWEALCTFILSQNNNIPRIKGLVSRLCQFFGDETEGGRAFPSAGRIASLSEEDLAPVRAGFRAKYILDAARNVSSGRVDLNLLYEAPVEYARESLQKIHGVGPKVAECTLLYGCARVECFPVDVWIRRVLSEFYPDGFPEEFAPVAGIAQQYLFHYIRNAGRKDAPQGKSRSAVERESARREPVAAG